MCWEEGQRQEAVEYYRSATELGHPAGCATWGLLPRRYRGFGFQGSQPSLGPGAKEKVRRARRLSHGRGGGNTSRTRPPPSGTVAAQPAAQHPLPSRAHLASSPPPLPLNPEISSRRNRTQPVRLNASLGPVTCQSFFNGCYWVGCRSCRSCGGRGAWCGSSAHAAGHRFLGMVRFL
jgi:hypothetical protein